MGAFDKFLNSLRLNDDYEEEGEFLDDEDELDDEEEEHRGGFFSKFMKRNDDDDEEEEETGSRKQQKTVNMRQPKQTGSKVTPMRRRNTMGMEVCVIKPKSVEDNREIADTLLANCTVVLNLEGMDVEVAQRIIDFSCGACYAIKGDLQKISSYIFILTPANVEVSGDIQDILTGTSNMSAIRTSV